MVKRCSLCIMCDDRRGSAYLRAITMIIMRLHLVVHAIMYVCTMTIALLYECRDYVGSVKEVSYTNACRV